MPLTPDELVRYSRHLQLPEVGIHGQEKLKSARVLVIGAGGLGSPSLLYLAAAGVGYIGIADFDAVEPHNLQRQIIHDTASIGDAKTASAARRLREINPHIDVVEHGAIDTDNAVALFGAYDVVLDGTDNFSTRYLDNDAAVLARRPLVHGSIYKFSGQVTVFAPHLDAPCQRCVFPEPPDSGSVPGCGEAGVLGVVCGVIGSLQALEAIKLITGVGEPLLGRLLTFDALTCRFDVIKLPRDPGCPTCGHAPQITSLDPARYDATCAAPPTSMTSSEHPFEIDVHKARELLQQNPANVRLIDVREPFEVEICRVEGAEHIPMRQIPEHLDTLPKDAHLLVFCHHGGRSERVTQFLRQNGFPAATNIAGGIDAWAREIEPGMPRY